MPDGQNIPLIYISNGQVEVTFTAAGGEHPEKKVCYSKGQSIDYLVL